MMQEKTKPARAVSQTQKRLAMQRAISTRNIMRHKMEDLRRELSLREFLGFEMCYDLFCEFYNDLLKEEENG
jgi:hypothetical protein